MEDPMLQGLPFEIGSLWPASLLGESQTDRSIFETLKTDFEALEPLEKDNNGHFDLHLDFPDLGHESESDQSQFENLERSMSRTEQEGSSASDAWDFDIGHHDESDFPRFHTWEAFEKTKQPDDERAVYLSEAGPTAFDAVLQSVEKSIGVLPQDITLRALCSLALGRSSSLFQWSHEAEQFVRTLAGSRLSGTSLLCSESLVEELLSLGNMTVRLRASAEASRPSHACPAQMALRSCTGLVIDAIEERISCSVGNIRSCLQLQQLVASPYNLLKILTTIHLQSGKHRTDEALISSFSELVHEYAESESQFCALLQALLARVSMPWLESLFVDLGLHTDPTGQCEQPAPVHLATDEDQRSAAFLSTDDQSLIHVTKHAISLLRVQSPGHHLFKSPFGSTMEHFRVHSMDRREAQQAANEYESHMTTFLLHGNDKTERQDDTTATELLRDDSMWADPSQLSYIADTEGLMSLEPGLNSPRASDRLREIAAAAIGGPHQNTAENDLLVNLGVSPMELIRPFVRAQHKLVNGILLRQLMRHHNLRQELELQRAFQLLGNGSFAARLSKALFDKDVQSAERKRGIVPTADDIGLRVGATKDQRWPPASSELQLSLMGLLTDSTGSGREASRSQLSFAIRELPEEEIERVLDPHSIYALDFLRLQYTTHAPISAVVTPISLKQYDGIFRYLLKLLRLLHVTADLPRTAQDSRHVGISQDTLAFAQRARTFVTVLTGHIMSVGIAPPWQTLTDALRILEHNLQAEDEQGKFAARVTMDIEGLRHLHERCLDRIRTRLFLKKKQEKLRTAVEDVLSSILKCATALQTEATDVVNAHDHESFVEKLRLLIKQLADIANKPPRTVSAADAEDLDMVQLLVAKLDWNGYYTGGVIA